MTEAEQKEIFGNWLSLHKALIFKIVRAYARGSMEQDDLFQEITIQIWRSIPAFRHKSAVTTWMYRVALNTAISWTRRERKHSRGEGLENAAHVLQGADKPIDEQLDWLYKEIAQLNEIDRSIVLLMLDGLSYKEMAGIIGITESNVGVKINRLKKYLISKSKQFDSHGIS